MPKEFTPSFAKRLDLRSSITVKEAKEGERIQPHTMYIAPGGYHLRLSKDFQTLTLGSDKKVHNCRPSVDVLFQSVKGFPGRQVCGILLTGMGKDGAAGMKIIHDMGGYTIAQDEDSSVVYGMPQAAVALGAVRHILPLSQIIPQVYAEFVGLGTPP